MKHLRKIRRTLGENEIKFLVVKQRIGIARVLL